MKGQSAIEYLMTYGWMLLVIAVVGAAIFSTVGEQQLEYSQVSGNDIVIDQIGTTPVSLDMVLRNTASDSVDIEQMIVYEDGQNYTFDYQKEIGVSETQIFRNSFFDFTDDTNTIEFDIIYDTSSLKDLSASGSFNGNVEVSRTLLDDMEDGDLSTANSDFGNWVKAGTGTFEIRDNPQIPGDSELYLETTSSNLDPDTETSVDDYRGHIGAEIFVENSSGTAAGRTKLFMYDKDVGRVFGLILQHSDNTIDVVDGGSNAENVESFKKDKLLRFQMIRDDENDQYTLYKNWEKIGKYDIDNNVPIDEVYLRLESDTGDTMKAWYDDFYISKKPD